MLVTQHTKAASQSINAMPDLFQEKLTIDSRFGTVEVDPDHAIFFPYGVPGILDNFHYGLTELPRNKQQDGLKRFKLLQSLNDTSISLVVLPLDLDNTLIAREDLLEACESLGIEPKQLVVLLVTSVHRTPDSITLSVNTRAPILIDSQKKLAAQYIFMNNTYEIRHIL